MMEYEEVRLSVTTRVIRSGQVASLGSAGCPERTAGQLVKLCVTVRGDF